MGVYRQYTVHDNLLGEKRYAYKEPCCFVCKHCTDVFWDYTHGPYMAVCGVCETEQSPDCDKYDPDEDCPVVDVTKPCWKRRWCEYE